MNKIKTIVLLLAFLFVILDYFSVYLISDIIKTSLLPILILLYCNTIKKISNLFLTFLGIYSIAMILDFIFNWIFPIDDDTYLMTNVLYIIAYIFLILEIVKSLNIKETINKHLHYVLILLALDAYCVLIVSNMSIDNSDLLKFNLIPTIIEVIYNIITLLLITFALLNYMSRGSKKAMNLVLGSLCILFSEIIQTTNMYVVDFKMLNTAHLIFLIMAFVFFYIQTNLRYEEDRLFDVNGLKI